jgi:transcription antitermination protein NusB
MVLSRQKFREIWFHLVYSEDVGQATDEDMLSFLTQQHLVSKRAVREAQELKNRLFLHRASIDQKIEETSVGYALGRIPKVERNILRLAIFELFYLEEAPPPKVVIAEAIRLARKYATPESASFVNAILDALHQGRCAQTLQEGG